MIVVDLRSSDRICCLNPLNVEGPSVSPSAAEIEAGRLEPSLRGTDGMDVNTIGLILGTDKHHWDHYCHRS